MMDIKGISKNGFVLFIIFTILLFAGCGTVDQEKLDINSEDNLVTDGNEYLDEDKNENAESYLEDENTNENEELDQEEVPMRDGLEVVNGNPIGEYSADDITKFIVTKETDSGTLMPDVYLDKEHPYIQEINDQLTEFLTALYEVDYKTITASRHEPFFEGELPEDSSFVDISGELRDEVITEVKEVQIRTINFENEMQEARVGSSVIYYVHQSSEEEHVYSNKYLEGKDMIVDVTTDLEKIDGEWKVTHAIELVPEILEDE